MIYDFNYSINYPLKVRILNFGLIFNEKEIETLKRPRKINIGLDVKNKALGIRPSIGDKTIKEYPFAINGNENWLRINCRKIVKEIEKITGITYGFSSVSYPCEFDYDSNTLIVKLK